MMRKVLMLVVMVSSLIGLWGVKPDNPFIASALAAQSQTGVANHHLNFKQQAKEGRLAISSEPSGAAVTINGRAVGFTPLDIRVSTGNLKVGFVLAGYAKKVIEVSVSDNSYLPVHANLLSSDSGLGRLEVTSYPSGALVSIDGRVFGRTPIDIQNVSLGNVQVMLSLNGYESKTVSIHVSENSYLPVFAELSSTNSTEPPSTQISKLLITSPLPGATASIDGEDKGEIPQSGLVFETSANEVNVIISAPGYLPKTQRVILKSGQTTLLNIKLEKVNLPEIYKPARTNIRALVIGIGAYGEDRIPKLEYAESDAKKFEAALKDPKTGNISSENVTALIGKQATKTRIEARIKSLAAQTQSAETLIVYFSGHGTPSAKGEPWLVPWDADPNDLPSSVIGLRDLQSTRTAGGNLVLILDSCFSGDAKGKSFAAPGSKPFGIVVKAPTVTGNVSVLSASGSDQSSFEGSSVGGSYLTHFLIEGMNGGAADQNGDGVVSLEEAFKYAKPKVEATALARNSVKQTPQLTGAGDVTLAVNVKAVSDARAGKLSVLLAAGKISPEQFEKLLEQVNAGQEAPVLKSFLNGSISEATFLAALKNGAIPGVPKR
jgi:Caspase domain/PEGA domain